MADTYTVAKGDSLWRIWTNTVRSDGTSWADFLAWQGLTPEQAESSYIYTGDIIQLSDAGETPEATEPAEDPPETPEASDTTDVSPAPGPVGAGTGMMGGGELVRVVRADQDDLWTMQYDEDGIMHVYTFASYDAMVQALGDTHPFTDVGEAAYDTAVSAGTLYDMGAAETLAGQSGTYATFIADLTKDAALAAGVRNPGMLGRYLSDPAISAIIAAGAANGWTELQIQAEIRNTDFYQNTLYPGISTLLDQGVDEPEAKWWAYHTSVEDSLAMLGYEKDDDGTYRTAIGDMMAGEISDTVFNRMAPQFHRASTSPEFANSLDYWLDKTAGRNVTFDDMFDAIAGQSEGDLAVAVESAVIQFQSTLHNTTLSDDQITRIAGMTELSEEQIATSFTTAEEALLALGDQGLARYGLTEQALVSSAFGLKEGNKTAREIQRLAAKTQKELGLQDDKKAQFYASFNERGSLIKPGLSALSPEAG